MRTVFPIVESLQSLLYLFYPSLCAACGRDLRRGEKVVCSHCRFSLPYNDQLSIPANPVEQLFYGKVPVAAAGSLLSFEKGGRVQQLAHHLKYGNRKDVGVFFGQQLGNKLMSANRFSTVDAVIPVPLHLKRLRTRGYNQAACISEGICEVTGFAHLPEGLLRTRASETQTQKQRYERFSNVAGIFKVAESTAMAGRHILLVDDVITTGSTLIACAEALMTVPDVKISIVAMAAAVH